MSTHARALETGLVSCHACGLVCEDVLDRQGHVHCPRCGAPLHRRKPNSLGRTWALLIAALILYIPANVLPVMYTNLLGSGMDSTIMSGVVAFWNSGSYGIALVIFIASVAVPCAKFLTLGLLLVTTGRGTSWARRERSKLYRMVEVIGYWSMLDVLVVAVIAALVKFQGLADIAPRIGILFFGMVVILTMLSAISFDPRLIWDGNKDE
ncbi:MULTISPECIES: paraquat-inducible protein A [unclassified Acidovorax]|jgi:paraquat-inducible protein A|uniref:paraquat-inducible protein A n=1 Tax=unclassified Acidovorax TaxID=2684926 RepID=UPI000B3F6701|nr:MULTISPECIES: paraquat-inducible protein A [unclassified Acidovorax]MBP3981092.1 paraquat-inducible protein A [Acidovorax sp. JG5]MBU4424828.1 paraquat-inducible protein A [Gammaproteobacteria bacterium]